MREKEREREREREREFRDKKQIKTVPATQFFTTSVSSSKLKAIY